jgi:hypothetical protein
MIYIHALGFKNKQEAIGKTVMSWPEDQNADYPHADEGLQKDGTYMSQIPTYVTAVPNGTEKVSIIPVYYFVLYLLIIYIGVVHGS